eukprot:SAG22_NODE_330_length_12211_cov_6.451948_11_plen_71_part_00
MEASLWRRPVAGLSWPRGASGRRDQPRPWPGKARSPTPLAAMHVHVLPEIPLAPPRRRERRRRCCRCSYC